MLLVEHRTGEPIEQLLRRLYWNEGVEYPAIAQLIGVPLSTLGQWMVRFKLTRRDAVAKLRAQELAS